ncbi:peptidase [Tropicimonas marinistellae]|uniref:peptidase n=1 Tax=Tropicimonas marinistellae TaxID=1739787 RepID=UPI00082E5E62|nr:peptidase [Tropicimonas marinistellae]
MGEVVATDHLPPVKNQLVVEIARKWIGTPYCHQASVRGAGADCLGLVRGIWRELFGGEPELVPTYTPDWMEAAGEERLWQAAGRHLSEVEMAGMPAPGEVVLFRMRKGAVAKHLGIAAERNACPSFIHAYSGHRVVESALTQAWQRRIVARFAFPKGVR